jgi:hypothetical protein
MGTGLPDQVPPVTLFGVGGGAGVSGAAAAEVVLKVCGGAWPASYR